MKKLFLCFVAPLFFLLYSCDSFQEDNYPKCNESRSYPYWTEWSGGELLSIVDDSLAVVTTSKYKKECGGTLEEVVASKTGLFLVNYRVKQAPLLGDTLESEYKILNSYYMDHGLRVVNGYLFRDTSALVFDLIDNKFGFWKIGEKTIEFRDHNKVSELKLANSAGYWVNENIIFNNIYNKNILNTEKGQIEQLNDWTLGYEWMQKCDYYLFLSYIDDKAVCVGNVPVGYIYEDVKRIEHRNILLLVDGTPVDTIETLGLPTKTKMLGSYFLLRNNHSLLQSRIFKIDTENLKFDNDFMLWVSEDLLKFYNDINKPDDFVSYSGQDLINFKGEQK